MPSPRRPDASHKKDFIRLLHENADRHRLYEVFSHFCELSALSLRNAVDAVGRAEREQRFHKIRERHTEAQMTRFSHMLGNLVMLMEDGFADTLGNLFMSLEFGNQYAGQFFTPYELQRLMAELTMTDVTAELIAERGGFIQMNEPACGAGGMVLNGGTLVYAIPKGGPLADSSWVMPGPKTIKAELENYAAKNDLTLSGIFIDKIIREDEVHVIAPVQ